MTDATQGQPSLLPEGHLFSQHGLNTYQRCPRRFLYKYVDRQPWPVAEMPDPGAYLDHLERGRIFHQWLARAALGLKMERFVQACEDLQLCDWWEAYRAFDHARLPDDVIEAELPVVVPVGRYRLYARYDLLALARGGEAVIVDWKTMQTRPTDRRLAERVQTRVYLYTLVAAGAVITGGMPVDPDQTRMLYWFANFPDQPARIRYSRAEYLRDRERLGALVEQIATQPREAFEPADDHRVCMRCNYRTLCRDGDGPGSDRDDLDGVEDWLDEDLDMALDLDDAPEIDF